MSGSKEITQNQKSVFAFKKMIYYQTEKEEETLNTQVAKNHTLIPTSPLKTTDDGEL